MRTEEMAEARAETGSVAEADLGHSHGQRQMRRLRQDLTRQNGARRTGPGHARPRQGRTNRC